MLLGILVATILNSVGYFGFKVDSWFVHDKLPNERWTVALLDDHLVFCNTNMYYTVVAIREYWKAAILKKKWPSHWTSSDLYFSIDNWHT